MKVVKKVIIVILTLLCLYSLLVFFEYNRFINQEKPFLITLYKEAFKDGGTINYKGLLYSGTVHTKLVKPVNGKIKSRTFRFLFFSKTTYDSVPYTFLPVSIDEFEIVDETGNCLASLQEFYRDYKYIYSYSCMKDDTTFIEFNEGTKMTISSALKKGIVTIDTLEKKGLKFYKEPIAKDVIEKISYNELEELINKKESFILVVIQTGCGHCIAYEPKLNQILLDNDLTAKSIDLVDINDSDSKKFNELFDVSGTPTTIFIEKGTERNVYERIVGNQSEEMIIKSLRSKGYVK